MSNGLSEQRCYLSQFQIEPFLSILSLFVNWLVNDEMLPKWTGRIHSLYVWILQSGRYILSDILTGMLNNPPIFLNGIPLEVRMVAIF